MLSFSSWVATAEELLENLQFGCRSRDELSRSTRSLVICLAKNYDGQGIAFKDLIQVCFILNL
ncbi:putative RNA polymerase sigma factor, region 2 [Helianthus anomalus]